MSLFNIIKLLKCSNIDNLLLHLSYSIIKKHDNVIQNKIKIKILEPKCKIKYLIEEREEKEMK